MSEKIIEIRKATQKQTITAIKSGDFSEVEKIEDTARQEVAKVFLAVASGSVPLIWYDLPPVRCQSGTVSVMRYALHRSPKKQIICNFLAWRLRTEASFRHLTVNIISLTAVFLSSFRACPGSHI